MQNVVSAKAHANKKVGIFVCANEESMKIWAQGQNAKTSKAEPRNLIVHTQKASCIGYRYANNIFSSHLTERLCHARTEEIDFHL